MTDTPAPGGGKRVPRDIKRVKLAEGTKEALKLRLEGLSYQEIADKLGLSKTKAYRRVQTAIEAIPRDEAEEVRAIELHRLDVLLRAVMPRALKGDTRSARVVLQVGERRAKLLGLDPPQNIAQVNLLLDKEQTAFLDKLEKYLDAENFRIALAVAAGELGGEEAGVPPGGRHPEGDAGPADNEPDGGGETRPP